MEYEAPCLFVIEDVCHGEDSASIDCYPSCHNGSGVRYGGCNSGLAPGSSCCNGFSPHIPPVSPYQ